MTTELFAIAGKRKYLTLGEQERFIAAANALERAEVRTFALTLAYTGCRISEAVEFTLEPVDLSAKAISFRTLKQRQTIYRTVPVHYQHIDALELVHRIQNSRRPRTAARPSCGPRAEPKPPNTTGG